MKPAHWAKVTKGISEKFAVPFKQAKEIYDRLGKNEGRKPSLRMVRALPKSLPAKLANAPRKKKTARVEDTTKTAPKPKTKEPLILPKGVELAPPPPPPTPPAVVPKRQPARNIFEKLLRERGLPVKGIARGGIGKEIAKHWRETEILTKLADQLKRGFEQVKKRGRMKEGTKNAVSKIMEKLFGPDRALIAWHAILRQLYGVGTTKVHK